MKERSDAQICANQLLRAQAMSFLQAEPKMSTQSNFFCIVLSVHTLTYPVMMPEWFHLFPYRTQ